jgi:hypothetical protein
MLRFATVFALGTLTVLTALTLAPRAAHAQTPPVVVMGTAPAQSGPPPSVAPTVPPGYEIEGELGGMHFRGRITTPSVPAPQPAPPPVMQVAPPPPAVVQAPPPAPPQVVIQYAQPQAYTPPPQPQYAPPQPQYAPPQAQYAQVQYPQLQSPYAQRDHAPRLDDEDRMDFGGRFGLELLGAGIAVGAAVGLGFAVNDHGHEEGLQMMTTMLATAGLTPTAISIFGGAIAHGRGRFGGAMLGEIVGGGLGAVILFAALDGGNSDPWLQMGVILGPAVVGAIVGFEIQHALRTTRAERMAQRAQQGLAVTSGSVAPVASAGAPVSGAMATLSGQF